MINVTNETAANVKIRNLRDRQLPLEEVAWVIPLKRMEYRSTQNIERYASLLCCSAIGIALERIVVHSDDPFPRTIVEPSVCEHGSWQLTAC